MRKAKLLAAGLILSASGCGSGHLNVTEICFIKADTPSCVCYYPSSKEGIVYPVDHCDRYQAMSPDNSSKVKEFVDRCLKGGIKP